jgi:hypothetical protein
VQNANLSEPRCVRTTFSNWHNSRLQWPAVRHRGAATIIQTTINSHMDPYSTDATPLVDKLAGQFARKYGAKFDPAKKAVLREPLLGALKTELPQVQANDLALALDDVYRRVRLPVDWNRLLCRLLSSLPGWWVKLKNNPGFGASTMLLLTDGTVMCQEQGGLRWRKLTPSAQGSYVDGTWSDLAPMHNTRRYYASAVLADGRVLVSGGEYSDAGGWTDKTEIYDPIIDVWTPIAPPPGWGNVGDSPCAVLADGRFFMGHYNSTKTAIYNPATNSWSAGPEKGSSSSEESWVLLPDNTVITVRCDDSQLADKYVATTNSWVSGGTLPQGIIEIFSSEIGAGVLLNDGRAFFAGANNHTALYSRPAVATDPGTWVSGPDFPNDPAGQTVGCKDTPSCLMTSGKVLVSAGPVDGTSWLTPTYFYEFDGSAFRRVSDPPNSTGRPYIGRMLLLPTGQILFAAQTDEIYAYSYFSCPDSAWRPQITSCPPGVRPWHSYTLQGRGLNGMSQAVGYGDDAAAATNYPLVRIRHLASGKVTYCRTVDHSTMGVSTGATLQSTTFIVPLVVPLGPSEICVVANGIASPPSPIQVELFQLRWPVFDETIIAKLIDGLAGFPLSVLGPRGPIPVKPSDPYTTTQANAAYKQITDGIKELQRLGKIAEANRGQAAQAQPLAPDEDTEEEDDG